MKKKNIIILCVLFFTVLLGVLIFNIVGHTSLKISYFNKEHPGTNISNVRCTYEMGRSVKLPKGRYSTKDDKWGIYSVNHSSAAYGLYTYTFDMEINGKIVSPQVDIMKTNWQDHCDIDIEIVVGFPEEDNSFCVTLYVDGMEIHEDFHVIENNDIHIQGGI